jgi:type IV secretory pathway TrbD component
MSLLTETVEKAKASFSDIVGAPGQLGGVAVEGTQKAVTGLIQTWMQNHPLWAWFISHPLISFGLILVMFFLLRGLLGAIVHFIEKLWIVTLSAPLKFGNWLLSASLGKLKQQAVPASNEHSTHQQLTDLVTRLEAMQTEQDELLKQVKTILEKV